MSIKEIGCCGAYCNTCMDSGISQNCKGCKTGYGEDKRDINKAKCKIKLCCFRDRKLETCADCKDYLNCQLIYSFYSKNGYKYKKYKEALEYIRKYGYDNFLRCANKWEGPYGKLPE